MRYIVEHYGSGTLSGIAAVMLLSVFIGMLKPGGMLHAIVSLFMAGITG